MTVKPIAFSPETASSVIHISEDASFSMGNDLKTFSRALLFRDQKVDSAWGASIQKIFEVGEIQFSEVVLDAGESLKDQQGLTRILEHMAAADLDRDSCVIAAGGGSLGDVVGFAASIWNRGVPWIAVPTTLLAMVDAHLGGKTAIQYGGIKNRIGSFHLPEKVWVEPALLKSLPITELRQGWAELIKSAVIGGGELLDSLQAGIPKNLIPDLQQLKNAMTVKVDVVNGDMYEAGQRRVLNLGHTLGHALEMESIEGQRDWGHGEAVSMGMVFAGHIADQCGISDEPMRPLISSLLQRVGLPLRPDPLPDPNRLLDRIECDKKSRSGVVSWVLPKKPGHMIIREFDRQEVQELLSSWATQE